MTSGPLFRGLDAGKTSFLGKHHSEKTKKIMSEKAKLRTGIKSSQYGTCWITNGQENKKIKKEDLDIWKQQGYYKGRILVKENH